jgi:hypothetical protein
VKLHQIAGILVVALAGVLCVASTEAGGGGNGSGECGALTAGAAKGEACVQKEECAEVCCLCENGEYGFVAQGCDLERGGCYAGDAVCELALQADGSLCGSAGDGE